MAKQAQAMDQQRADYHQQIRKHLNSAYLLTEEKIETVLPRFLHTIGSLMADLEEFVNTGNIDSLSRTGHALKGALLNLGLPELAEKAYAIERHNQASDHPASYCTLVDELGKEIKKLI